MCVRWGSVFSDFFLVNNGVRHYTSSVSHCQSCLLVAAVVILLLIILCMLTILFYLLHPQRDCKRLCYAYGCEKTCDDDIICNSSKSQVMFFDTLKYGHYEE